MRARLTFDETDQNFAGPPGLASFGDIRSQGTADNADGALPIRSDAEVYGALLQTGAVAEYTFQQDDAGYLVPATGEVEVNGARVLAREGLIIQDEKEVSVKALTDTELVLVVTRQISSPIRSSPMSADPRPSSRSTAAHR